MAARFKVGPFTSMGSVGSRPLDGPGSMLLAGKFTVNTPVGASFEVPFTGQGNVPLLKP